MRRTHRAKRCVWLALPLLGFGLASCSGDTPAPQDFPPLHYEYLTPLRLNVATISTDDQAAPVDGDLASRSPVTPEAAMEQMARDRLVAAGPSGTATLTITEASITRGEGGALVERLSAHLDIASADGSRAAFAEAHVTRSSKGEDNDGPAALYDLTKAAMADMNVEFEYQVRHSLHDWLVSGNTIEAPVQATPLPGSGPINLAPPGVTPAVTAPLSSVPPSSATPSSVSPAEVPPSSQAPAPQLSPPPGFLVPPPGAMAPTSYPPPSSAFVPPAGGGY